MPIEIKELHIKTVIDNSKNRDEGAGAVPAQRRGDRDMLIAECVERVLEILQSRNER